MSQLAGFFSDGLMSLPPSLQLGEASSEKGLRTKQKKAPRAEARAPFEEVSQYFDGVRRTIGQP